jgi:hypothetical protein
MNGVSSQQINFFLNITNPKYQILFSFLMTLSLSRQYNVGDGMINGGVKIRRRTQSTRRKPAPLPISPPQIPHNLS